MKPVDPLSASLQTWQHRAQAQPDFCDCVWKRIQSSSQAGSGKIIALSSWKRLSIGWAAAAAVALASVLGSTAAYAYGNITRSERQAVAYFKSIDPVQRSLTHTVHPHP